jgi:peptide/nickel transport system substrate-binding protein
VAQESEESPGGVARRAVLGTVAGVGAGVTGGCLQQLGPLLGDNSPAQLSLTVKTVPADADTAATRIARRLVTNLTAAGVDAKMELQPRRELRRDVLVNGSFDLYVGRYPDRHDPDFLRPLCHSVFAGEGGWQNPFAFTDITVDDLLREQQGATGRDRQRIANRIQRQLASTQPFGLVAFPDEVWATRRDRFTEWDRHPPTNPLSFVALDTAVDGPDRHEQLRVTTTNASPTRNLNPLAVQHRGRGIFTGLLYDRLARFTDGTVTPWLAENVSWSRQGTDAVGTVRLRPDLRWHDGEALTASDVAFTYRFLQDTLLGSGDAPAPALRFRGRASLVDTVTVADDRTLQLRCADTAPPVAARALTVPILPAHIWRERAIETTVAWADGDLTLTQAMVWPNPRPVGSGVVQFEGRAQDESLVLTRFDDHFLHRSSAAVDPSIPGQFAHGVAFDRLSVRVVPSDGAAIQLLGADEADATAMRLAPDAVPRVGEDPELGLHVESGRSFYHVGFNTRREPLGNPHVRRAIVRLLDTGDIARRVFDGYAQPAASPLAGTEWLAPSLAWDGADPEVPFVGEDGQLDEQRARELFRDAGLEYSDEGRVLD